MGANAVTTVPVYVAGEVLTAADLNITNSGIPVFATTVTRDAAFGGTGEKTLAEGQFAYIEATNTTQYYDGAVWQSVGTTPGLVCVKAETAFTTVASITVDNVFTSSYTDYILKFRATASAANALYFQLRVGGVTNTTNWVWQSLEANNTTVSATTASAQSQFRAGNFENDISNLSSQLNIYSPAEAVVTTVYGDNIYTSGTSTTNMVNWKSSGYNNNATAFDGFVLSISAGTISGVYSVYGYSKTV